MFLYLAGFRLWIADYANRLARPFTCPGISRSALTTHGQAFPMTNATITIDCLQTFQVTLHIATEIAFDLDLVVRNGVNDFVQLLRRKIFRADVRVDVGLLENASGSAKADSVDIGQGRFDALIGWNFNSE